jgi:hypothetical protein
MDESKKLSIAYCKKVLQQAGKEYTEEQIGKIRDVLYALGELDYCIFKEMKINDPSMADSSKRKKPA